MSTGEMTKPLMCCALTKLKRLTEVNSSTLDLSISGSCGFTKDAPNREAYHVEMTAVRDHQASGVIELWNGDPPELVPQVGWRLSSRSPYALSRDRDNAGGTPAIPDSDRSD